MPIFPTDASSQYTVNYYVGHNQLMIGQVIYQIRSKFKSAIIMTLIYAHMTQCTFSFHHEALGNKTIIYNHVIKGKTTTENCEYIFNYALSQVLSTSLVSLYIW